MKNITQKMRLLGFTCLGLLMLSACNNNDDDTSKTPTKTQLTSPAGLNLSVDGTTLTAKWSAVDKAKTYTVYYGEKLVVDANSNQLNTADLTQLTNVQGINVKQGVVPTNHSITGLDRGKTYSVFVQAMGDPATTTPSVIKSGDIKSMEMPKLQLAAPADLTLTLSGTTLTANWTAADSAKTYTVYYGEKSIVDANTDKLNTSDLSQFTAVNGIQTQQGIQPTKYDITGLSNGKTYSVFVQSVGDTATTIPSVVKASDAKSMTTPLSAPAGLSLTATGQKLKVDWNTVSDASSYKVYLAEQAMSTLSAPSFANHGQLTGSQIQPVTSGTTHTFTGLGYGKTYYVVVQSIGNGSTALNSTYANGQERNETIAVPTPTNLQAKSDVVIKTNPSDDSYNLTVSWNRITGITEYDVYSSNQDLTNKTLQQIKQDNDVTKTRVTITNTQDEQHTVENVGRGNTGHVVVVAVAHGTESSMARLSAKIKEERFYHLTGYVGKCVFDRNEDLIWEVKQTSGLHGANYKYSWYDPNPSTNNGDAGHENRGWCHNQKTSSNPQGVSCDTAGFIKAVNAENNGKGLCGLTNWRLPTANQGELTTLIDATRKAARKQPVIDINFFPNTMSDYYWSSVVKVTSTPPFVVHGTNYSTSYASDGINYKINGFFARLVHDRR